MTISENDIKKIAGVFQIVGLLVNLVEQVRHAVEADETMDPALRAAIRAGYDQMILAREVEQARLDGTA